MIDLITYLKSLNIYNIIIYLICFLIFFMINIIVLIKLINLTVETFSSATFLMLTFIELALFSFSFTSTNIISALDFSDKEITNCLISMHVGMGLSLYIVVVKFFKIYLRR